MRITIDLTDDQIRALLRQLGYPNLMPIKSKRDRREIDALMAEVSADFDILE